MCSSSAGGRLVIKTWLEPGERLLAAVAARRSESGHPDGYRLDVNALIHDGLLHWDIPDGFWRVHLLIETQIGGGNLDYLNPIDPASCRVLIDAVYEPHYARYKAEFGKTFAGFFTDEPNIGNGGGWADAIIGRKRMVLPWRAGLLHDLSRELGDDATLHLPGLWHANGPSTWRIRYGYMNLVSRLYGECFSQQLGDWCRERGVESIGHIIEDNDAHARLGDSAAHFFRSMQGQDMSGVDIVLSQLRPGLDRQGTNWWGPDHADGEFFHYALGKLGASHAHLDPRKQGRALCEIYGAYGWAEGLRLMKWMTDHMLVRGVNWYMPHAFSPKEFPDPDCPPHFYARGRNPQFRHFRLLMHYANRMCHLLNGGRHEAEAAVLYHAEAEWSGRAMSVKEPLRALMQAQYDGDVIPLDTLLHHATVQGGCLSVTGETFRCLILPWAERLPRAALARIRDLLHAGLRVLCVNAWPAEASEGPAVELLAGIAEHPLAASVPLEEIPARLRAWGMPGVAPRSPAASLRRYHYCHADYTVWVFFNESPHQAVDTSVWLPGVRRLAVYDAFTNRLLPHLAAPDADGVRVPLALAPAEARVFVEGEIPPPAAARTRWSQPLCAVPARLKPWRVSSATAEAYPDFTPWRTLDALVNVCRPGLLPEFSGTLRYETALICQAPLPGAVYLDLGEVGETAEVWVNQQPAGVCLARPYILDVSAMLKPGENDLRVEVTTHLGYAMAQKDAASRYFAMEASGLVGPVHVLMEGGVG